MASGALYVARHENGLAALPPLAAPRGEENVCRHKGTYGIYIERDVVVRAQSSLETLIFISRGKRRSGAKKGTPRKVYFIIRTPRLQKSPPRPRG